MNVKESLAASDFDLVGGQSAVDHIVDLFYDRMDRLPEAQSIRAMHPRDLFGSRTRLKKYLAQWLGGPQQYSQERGHPRLRMRHQPFRIGIPERDTWLTCMRGALEDVVASPRLREYLMQSLFKVADWMRIVTSPEVAMSRDAVSAWLLDIAIVSGGLSGLALAHRLHRERRHIGLFEARARLGGRILSSSPGEHELGKDYLQTILRDIAAAWREFSLEANALLLAP